MRRNHAAAARTRENISTRSQESIALFVRRLAPMPATAASLPPLIPRALLFGNPEKSAPRLSPDGQRLAYLAPDDRGVLNVWVRTLGQEDDHVVTADKK